MRDISNQRVVAGVMVPGTEDLLGLEWWLAQNKTRDYQRDILDRMAALPRHCQVNDYGTVVYGDHQFPVKYVTVGDLSNPNKHTIFITGGEHPYELGAIEGAFNFLEDHVTHYLDDYNFVVVPCVSPAAYERDLRLNGAKQNTNRQFFLGSTCQETKLLMDLIHTLNRRYEVSIHGHETTWTDPVVIFQETGKWEDVIPEAYVLESATVPPHLRLGYSMIEALEEMGLPVNKAPDIDGWPNNNGVLFGLEKKIPTLSMAFMVTATDGRHAPAVQSITTEPFVTEELYDRPDGLRIRATAQVLMICATLETLTKQNRPFMTERRLMIGS